MTDFDHRRSSFAKLHESGCFVIPNPWDVGTARFLHHLGFRALATTSADFQSGYAHEPEEVAANVGLCVDTGVAGLSIEDATGAETQPLYDLPFAIRRIQAARRAIDAGGAQVLLTARAESYLVGHPEPLEDVLARLTAYAEAGADVLYAPGPRTREELGAIVRAVAPKPVNALVRDHVGLSVEDLAELGVRRISVGSALALAAWGGFIRAATAIAETGSFEGLEGATPFAELDRVFGAYQG